MMPVNCEIRGLLNSSIDSVGLLELQQKGTANDIRIKIDLLGKRIVFP